MKEPEAKDYMIIWGLTVISMIALYALKGLL